MLAFTSVYFSESGLFNGLRPIGIKKFCPFTLRLHGLMDPPGSRQLFRRISAPSPSRPISSFAPPLLEDLPGPDLNTLADFPLPIKGIPNQMTDCRFIMTFGEQ